LTPYLEIWSQLAWHGKMQSKQQSTEKTGVDVWPNVSLTRVELRSKVRLRPPWVRGPPAMQVLQERLLRPWFTLVNTKCRTFYYGSSHPMSLLLLANLWLTSYDRYVKFNTQRESLLRHYVHIQLSYNVSPCHVGCTKLRSLTWLHFEFLLDPIQSTSLCRCSDPNSSIHHPAAKTLSLSIQKSFRNFELMHAYVN